MNKKAFKFNYNMYDWKSEGVIFFITSFAIPFVTSLILKLGFNLNSEFNNTSQLAYSLIFLASITAGFIIISTRQKGSFWQSSGPSFYLFIYIPIAVSIAIQLLTSMFISKSIDKTLVNSYTSIISQGIAEVFIIAFAIGLNKNILKAIKSFFTSGNIKKMLIIIFSFLLLVLFSNIIFTSLWNQIFNIGDSKNQELLLEPLKREGLKSPFLWLLLLLTVFIAPLCEEISTRDSIFTISSNKILGFFNSSLYFGFMHFGGSGDFSHGIGYIVAGFILAGTFLLCDGNFTYTWIIHLIYNLFNWLTLLWLI